MPSGAAPAVGAFAEHLPFPDDTFDAAMAVLTMHHWHDVATGLAEMRRVARRQVLFYFEPSFADDAWIVADYFPEILELESERNAPGRPDIERHLDVVSIEAGSRAGRLRRRVRRVLLEPARGLPRPARATRACRRSRRCRPRQRDRGMQRLRAEIASGEWDRKYGHLRALGECDLGYRLIVGR